MEIKFDTSNSKEVKEVFELCSNLLKSDAKDEKMVFVEPANIEQVIERLEKK